MATITALTKCGKVVRPYKGLDGSPHSVYVRIVPQVRVKFAFKGIQDRARRDAVLVRLLVGVVSAQAFQARASIILASCDCDYDDDSTSRESLGAPCAR